jgi:O-antigen/teichoic acid export membrane protein
MQQSLKDKTAKGLFWGGISNGVQQLLGLVFGIALARLLSPEDYGLVGMLVIFTAVASTIQESGFTAALINKQNIEHKDYNAVFWFSLAAGVIMYIICFFAAPLIAAFYQEPALTDLSRIVFLGFLFGSAGTGHNAYLMKNLLAKERAKIDIIAIIFSGSIGVVMAFYGLAYWGLAIQGAMFMGISTLLKWLYTPWRPTLHINLHPLKAMFNFSSKLFITNIFWQITSNQFSVLLGKFYTPQEVGYYSQGNKWMGMGQSLVAGMINGVAQPIFAQVHGDKERQAAIFRKIVRFGAFVSFPLLFGLAFVAEEFILIAIGEKWLPSVPFLQLFCIWGAFTYLWNIYVNLLLTHGKSNIYMYVMIFISLMQMGILVLTFPLGILWMVAAYVGTFFIGLLIWNYFAYRLIGISLAQILKDIIPYLSVTLITFASTWAITYQIDNIYMLIIAKCSIAAIIYILIMWKSNAVVFNETIKYLKGRQS